MTREQRENLVELLQCAADVAISFDLGSAIGWAMDWTGTSSADIGQEHWSDLIVAMSPWQCDGQHISGEGYEWLLLELAARVREGSWP